MEVRLRRGLAFERPSGQNVRATGRTKTVRTYGRIHNVQLYEMQHAGRNDRDEWCGRTFWSNHPQARRLFCLAGKDG